MGEVGAVWDGVYSLTLSDHPRLWAEEMVLGNSSNFTNVFRWDEVRLNLPGSLDYDPSLPWIAKVQWSDGLMACCLFIYVDDVQVLGNTEIECWGAACRMAAVLNRLGLQDAAQKQRKPSQELGA